MKLVHAADLHLDSPLVGLERHEGAPVERLRGATRRALAALVELCLSEAASILVIAGDLYDGGWRDYSTGLYFVHQMSRLRDAGVRVVTVRGNHDAASQLARTLRLPDHVRDLSFDAPETLVFDDLGLAVHGQSFATREVRDDLAARYPDRIPGLFNLGLLHTAATGRPGHESYAPCTIETLRSKGYDYWALGHVHRREVLSRDPWIVFPGNLQGRHVRETGEKGATLVTIEAGRVADVEHRCLDVVRWADVHVDGSGADDRDQVLERVRDALAIEVRAADGRPLAARVRLAGATAAHATLASDPERWIHDVRAAAADAGGEVWIEKALLATTSTLDLPALAARGDAIGDVVRALLDPAEHEAVLAEARAELEALRLKLPPEIREGDDGLRLDDDRVLRGMLADAAELLVPRLLSRLEADEDP